MLQNGIDCFSFDFCGGNDVARPLGERLGSVARDERTVAQLSSASSLKTPEDCRSKGGQDTEVLSRVNARARQPADGFDRVKPSAMSRLRPTA